MRILRRSVRAPPQPLLPIASRRTSFNKRERERGHCKNDSRVTSLRVVSKAKLGTVPGSARMSQCRTSRYRYHKSHCCFNMQSMRLCHLPLASCDPAGRASAREAMSMSTCPNMPGNLQFLPGATVGQVPNLTAAFCH